MQVPKEHTLVIKYENYLNILSIIKVMVAVVYAVGNTFSYYVNGEINYAVYIILGCDKCFLHIILVIMKI